MKRLISVLFLALAATSSCDREEDDDTRYRISADFFDSVVGKRIRDYPEWCNAVIEEAAAAPGDKLKHLEIFSGSNGVIFIRYDNDHDKKGIPYWHKTGEKILISSDEEMEELIATVWWKVFDYDLAVEYMNAVFGITGTVIPPEEIPGWLQAMIDEFQPLSLTYNDVLIYKCEWKNQTVYMIEHDMARFDDGYEWYFENIYDENGNKINFADYDELSLFFIFSKNWRRIYEYHLQYHYDIDLRFYENAPYEPVDTFPEWLQPTIDAAISDKDNRTRIFRGEWNSRIVYMIDNELTGHPVLNAYYEDGELITYNRSGETRLYMFALLSKNWKKIYDSTLQDES